MSARIKTEMSVGLTPEIAQALNIATEFSGLRPSQYGRMAILERLVREGFLKHPGIINYGNLNAEIKQPE